LHVRPAFRPPDAACFHHRRRCLRFRLPSRTPPEHAAAFPRRLQAPDTCSFIPSSALDAIIMLILHIFHFAFFIREPDIAHRFSLLFPPRPPYYAPALFFQRYFTAIFAHVYVFALPLILLSTILLMPAAPAPEVRHYVFQIEF